jgi:Zn-dependent protease with chaperone function
MRWRIRRREEHRFLHLNGELIPATIMLILLGQAMIGVLFLPLVFGALFAATYLLGLLVNLISWLANLFLVHSRLPFLSTRTIVLISALTAAFVCASYIWRWRLRLHCRVSGKAGLRHSAIQLRRLILSFRSEAQPLSCSITSCASELVSPADVVEAGPG